MNIKQASKLTGVSADTIRYYEKIGLIHPIKRLENGNRDIEEEDLNWILFAKQMRKAGMSINILTNYVQLFSEGDETIDDRKQLIAEQLDDLKEKQQAINEAIDRLEFKLENYDSHMRPVEQSLNSEKNIK